MKATIEMLLKSRLTKVINKLKNQDETFLEKMR